MQIRIQSYSFTLSSPFAAGHVCSAAEAATLNSIRADRIRNQAARLVNELGMPGEELTADQISEVQSRIEEIERYWQFKLPTQKPLNLNLERECEAVARERLEIRQRQLGQMPVDEYDEYLAKLKSDPDVQIEARKRLAARQEIAQQALTDLLS